MSYSADESVDESAKYALPPEHDYEWLFLWDAESSADSPADSSATYNKTKTKTKTKTKKESVAREESDASLAEEI